MNIGRLIGLAAGVCGTFGASAHAETGDGVAFELAVSAAEIDLMSLDYGHFGDVDGGALLEQSASDLGERFDTRVSGIDWSVFGHSGEVYFRGSYQQVEGGGSASYTGDLAYAPTGFEGFDEYQIFGLGGGGSITAERAIEQIEGEIAAGFVFKTEHGFAPRIEFGYRRGEIDQTISVDRVGVTPMLEQFGTETSGLESDCAELGLGAAKVLPLSESWSFIADASLGLGFCRHDLEGDFVFVDGFGGNYTSAFDDSLNGLTARAALSAGLSWRLTDMLALGVNAYAGAESDAPYIAYPTYTFDPLGDVNGSVGVIRIETETRASYGIGLSLRLALD